MTSQWSGFHSVFADGTRRYLESKRAFGRRFVNEENALRLLDRFLVQRGATCFGEVTAELLDEFLLSRPRKKPRSFNQLLGVVGRLLDFMVGQEMIQCSPLRPVPRRETERRLPFLFNVVQARSLLDAAARLQDDPRAPLRGPTYRAVFALLFGLGLRVGEVTRLRRADVDLERSLLVVRDTKFGKSRLVPFGPQMAVLLRVYLDLSARKGAPVGPEPLVFSFDGRTAINRHSIDRVFRQLTLRLGLTASAGVTSPRVHDLRHSFAVGTLLRWYKDGQDPAAHLYHLSTFLGHVSPSSTAVYLTITNDLLQQASQRFEVFAAPALVGGHP